MTTWHTIVVPLRKRVAHPGGFTTVPDGEARVEVRVVIDLPQLARVLGRKAYGNRSHKTRLLGGLIVVTVSDKCHPG